jgi:hypothetical protein
LLCPFPVRHMSVISRPVERVTGNCDGPWRRLERVVDAGPAETPRRSVRYKRMQHRSVRAAGRQAKTWRASSHEDVPVFVELESGGPSPGACRVVGHG